MKTLLHSCCAPCTLKCAESLRKEEIEPVLFWYNPNIHPFTEYKSRKESLTNYANEKGFELKVRDEYGLRTFISGIYPDFSSERCMYCYTVRMEAVAKYASEHGFNSFSTSLLISPYQNHDQLVLISERAAKRYNVLFLYRDFRPLFREGQKEARGMGLYMQKYCGCIFSEEDRYSKTANMNKRGENLPIDRLEV